MTGPRSLADAQRRFQHALLTPHDAPEQAARAARDLVTSTERLALYRRGCRLRLLETMRALYPGLRALLGPELFDDFAQEYLDTCPSRSYTLARLGERFPAYLADHRPDRDEPPRRREPWIDLLIDLARYERTFAEVYDGPGTEGQGRSESTTSPVPAGALLDGVPFPAPCLRLMRVCAPVHEYLAAVFRGRAAEPPGMRTTALALFRRDYVVVTTELAAGPYRLLSALLDGATTVREAAGRSGTPPAEALALLGEWRDRGWLAVRGSLHGSTPGPPVSGPVPGPVPRPVPGPAPREEKTTA
ncbi:DNA-binding domain-containing protein [Streptomyces sp. SCA3-4]|uniref:HvfC/BufC N-terminal domain-containing protein n=1 Tax=Streptomyces sichuanensis TaxID=2871810 RepID=UPI001CE2DF1B|nr:DNA-binding domain-containing protein [Streptomyces sichuanensis]MCA6091100.1 DNA-binding domain-containing protein [Streptomyces sichuanensis]